LIENPTAKNQLERQIGILKKRKKEKKKINTLYSFKLSHGKIK
jgi:hypothetical protein